MVVSVEPSSFARSEHGARPGRDCDINGHRIRRPQSARNAPIGISLSSSLRDRTIGQPLVRYVCMREALLAHPSLHWRIFNPCVSVSLKGETARGPRRKLTGAGQWSQLRRYFTNGTDIRGCQFHHRHGKVAIANSTYTMTQRGFRRGLIRPTRPSQAERSLKRKKCTRRSASIVA